jgi:RimJ/RimL family protein N-acetyltransferase
MKNPILIGERLYLRPEEVEDAKPIARWDAEETDDFIDVGRFPLSPILFAESAKKGSVPDMPRGLALIACLRDNEEPIGIIGLVDFDWINRTAETFSFFAPGDAYRGHGYGTEAKLLLLEYGFERLGLHAIQSVVWEANERSTAALLKQGYQPAGRLKWDRTRRGVYMDALLFDIKRDEWLAAREAVRARTSPDP